MVLETAAPGIARKSDRDGVRLALAEAGAVAAAYESLARRLGPRVVAAPMAAGPAVDMILGLVYDQGFGPVILLGSGGLHAELLRDVVFALPPFDAAEACRLLDRLRLRLLLDGSRGAPPADVAAFSAMAVALRGLIVTIDVNPVLVRPAASQSTRGSRPVPGTPAGPREETNPTEYP